MVLAVLYGHVQEVIELPSSLFGRTQALVVTDCLVRLAGEICPEIGRWCSDPQTVVAAQGLLACQSAEVL